MVNCIYVGVLIFLNLIVRDGLDELKSDFGCNMSLNFF
jgi:hypothetical protein